VTDDNPAGGESMMVQGQDGTWRLTGAALQEHPDGTFTLHTAGLWTRHGQPVPGISPAGVGPEAIDCGGIAHCSTCRRDATRIRDAYRNQAPAERTVSDYARTLAQTGAEVRAQLTDTTFRRVVVAELRRLGYTITGP
jgi:hypothetical protein